MKEGAEKGDQRVGEGKGGGKEKDGEVEEKQKRKMKKRKKDGERSMKEGVENGVGEVKGRGRSV